MSNPARPAPDIATLTDYIAARIDLILETAPDDATRKQWLWAIADRWCIECGKQIVVQRCPCRGDDNE